MIRKLKSRLGFTMTEIMVVIVIMSFVTSAGAVAISNLLAERAIMIRVSDAEILGSSVLQAVANELRFGNDIKVSEKAVTLDSLTYGADTSIHADDGKLVFGNDAKQILNDSAYNGLKISNLSFANSSTEAGITITVSICYTDDHDIWSGSFTVVPLNGSHAQETASP